MYSVLGRKQLDEIHSATLAVLEQIGVIVHDSEALELLEAAGCEVHKTDKIAKFPRKVVDSTLQKTPRTLVLVGRDREHDLPIGYGRVFTRPVSGYTRALDVETERSRSATLADVECAAKLIDALDNISFCTTHVFPSDVPSGVADVYVARIFLENTRKHLFFSPLTNRTFQTIIAMAKAVRGDEDEFRRRPLVSFLVATSSPLKIAQDCDPNRSTHCLLLSFGAPLLSCVALRGYEFEQKAVAVHM